jgi:hypothetical protein
MKWCQIVFMSRDQRKPKLRPRHCQWLQCHGFTLAKFPCNMYKFFMFKEFNYICNFFYHFFGPVLHPTSQTSGVSILHPTALYQTSDLLQCMAICNRCHMDGTFSFCLNMKLARQWNELQIFLTGDNIHTNTLTVICSFVLYKFLLLFCIRSAGNPEELEVHLYVMFIWLINIVLWHV